MLQYSLFISTPTYRRLYFTATNPVVPAPLKGSRTMSPSRDPARIQGVISSGGNVAKCASLNGLVATVQTERLFLDSPSHGTDPQTFDPVPSGHPRADPGFRSLFPDLPFLWYDPCEPASISQPEGTFLTFPTSVLFRLLRY